MSEKVKSEASESAGVDQTALQAAFDALMSISLNSASDVTIPAELRDQLLAQEAAVDPIPGGDDGVTPSMKAIIRRAGGAALSEWANGRARFDAALQPVMQKIQKVREFDVQKQAAHQKSVEREREIIHQAESKRIYLDRKIAKENADRHFQQLLQGEGGRPVTSFGNSWAYIFVLVGVTSVEWLVNYESFFDWTRVPAIAAGFTIGMAAAVAFAAHIHGEYLKQRNSRFSAASATKGRDITFLAFATAGLLVALFVAGRARYSSALASIGAQTEGNLLEGATPINDPLTDVYFSLGINLIIWLIGLIIAFMAHDENHELMRAELEQWWRTKRFNRVHKPIEKTIRMYRAQSEREIGQLRAATELARISSEKERIKLEQIEDRERALYRTVANNVQSSVDLYRMALSKLIEQKGHHVMVRGKLLPAAEFRQLPINIDVDMLRKLI